jgi:hypothetical protein
MVERLWIRTFDAMMMYQSGWVVMMILGVLTARLPTSA